MRAFPVLAVLLALILLTTPITAAPIINPSVDSQPFWCSNSLTGWACDIAQRGPAGTDGVDGHDNLTAIYHNSTNVTASINNASFFNTFNLSSVKANFSFFNNTYGNLTLSSNYTVVNGGNYYNISGAINESHLYGPGKPGGQSWTCGTGANDDCYINGTSSSTKTDSIVSLQKDGGVVVIGNTSGYFTNNTLNIKTTGIVGAAAFAVKTDQYGSKMTVLGGTGSNHFYFQPGSGISRYYDATNAEQMDLYNAETQTISLRTAAYSSTYFNTPNGKFGIGTNSPTSMFDVTGSIRLRNCSGTPTFDAGGNLTCVSDEKLKTNIKPLKSAQKNTATTATQKISSLADGAVLYQYSPQSGFDSTSTHAGFIAGDVQNIIPEATICRKDVIYKQVLIKKGQTPEDDEYDTVGVPTGTETCAIDQGAIIAQQAMAIKELSQEIDTLKAEAARLQDKKVDKT